MVSVYGYCLWNDSRYSLSNGTQVNKNAENKNAEREQITASVRKTKSKKPFYTNSSNMAQYKQKKKKKTQNRHKKK